MIKVLVTNDDGIDAIGLISLVEKLADHAEVYVVAPADQQSAKSHSITFLREVHTEERELKGAVAAWTVDGTPVDCVKWALGRMEEKGIRPDFVFSGINMGLNVGLAAYYSGTIGAAREGALNGVRSIALSVGNHQSTMFDYVLGKIPEFIALSQKVSPSTILSVNAPELKSWEIKGMRIVPAAPFGYGEKFVFRHVEGMNYQMGAEEEYSNDEMRYDIDWVRKGYATVSPIPTTLQDPVALMKLRDQAQETECLAVIVDAQDGVLGDIKKPKKFARNIGVLAHCMSRMSIPVIITETFGRGDTIEEVRKYSKNAAIVEHTATDPWSAPDMESHVASVDPDRIIIAGALTDVAVKQAALGFISRGYAVTIAEDCCASTSKENRRLAADELREAGCHIESAESLIMELAGGCSRQVLDAVKNIVFS